MTLKITRVALRSFRNWDEFEIHPDPELTLIVGPNAAGKTNLIEAVQLTTSATSFRHPLWKDLVKHGDSRARVTLEAQGDGRKRDVVFSVGNEGRRAYEVNGAAKRTVRDVAGVLPSVVFTPDDLGLVKESAQRRRSELDDLGSQLSKSYRDLRTEYDRAVRQRNALLRDGAEESAVFSAWTTRMLETGSRLAIHRVRLFERMRPHIERQYERVSAGELLAGAYRSAWWDPDTDAEAAHVAEQLERALTLRSHDERARRVTLAGPHRDDVTFLIEGQDARVSASQGQQRTISLAWKLAEVAVVEELTGSTPVLLLDDVMSELDENRRAALSETVMSSAQTIVTTTNLGYFDERTVDSAQVVRIGG